MRRLLRARGPLGAFCLGGLALCVGAWVWLHHSGQIGMLSSEFERTEGAEVGLSLVRVRAIEGAERYVVEKGALPIDIAGDASGRTVGEEVNLLGVWSEAERAVVPREVHSATEGRRHKRTLGLLGLGLAALLWGAAVRGRPGAWRLSG